MDFLWLDQQIIQVLQDVLPAWVRSLAAMVTHLGDVGIIWLVLAGILVWKKKPWSGVLVVVGIALSFVVGNLVLKELVARPRPFMEIEGLVPIIKASGYSFPSGHAMSSFTAAGIFYGLRPSWGPGVYLLATIIALTRIILGVHYLSDILAGALIGSLIAYLVVGGRDYLAKERPGSLGL